MMIEADLLREALEEQVIFVEAELKVLSNRELKHGKRQRYFLREVEKKLYLLREMLRCIPESKSEIEVTNQVIEVVINHQPLVPPLVMSWRVAPRTAAPSPERT